MHAVLAERPCSPASPITALYSQRQGVVGAAILVATAFRMRDETGLMAMLRLLADVVDELEQAEPEDA